MLTETGRVVAVEADGLWVETLRKSTCGSCTARSGCGHGLMNRLGEGRSSYIRVLPGEGDIAACKIDDEVRIGIPEELLLRGSLMVYVLPLLGLLGGASLGANLLPLHSDLATLAGAVRRGGAHPAGALRQARRRQRLLPEGQWQGPLVP